MEKAMQSTTATSLNDHARPGASALLPGVVGALVMTGIAVALIGDLNPLPWAAFGIAAHMIEVVSFARAAAPPSAFTRWGQVALKLARATFSAALILMLWRH